MTIRNLIDELRAASDALSPDHEISVDSGVIIATRINLDKFEIESANPKLEDELEESRDEVRELGEQSQRNFDRMLLGKAACRAAIAYIADGLGSKKEVLDQLARALE